MIDDKKTHRYECGVKDQTKPQSSTLAQAAVTRVCAHCFIPVMSLLVSCQQMMMNVWLCRLKGSL